MIDITEIIKKSINEDVLWSVSSFFDVLGIFKENSYDISYWENEENWATIIVNGIAIGYLWKKYPLLFILKDHFLKNEIVLKKFNYLNAISVDDLNDQMFKLEYDTLKDYLEYGTDYDKFSATDLWFGTNSI